MDYINCEDKITKLVEIFGDSRGFARLWAFYRNHFSSDNNLLEFFCSCLKNQPTALENVGNAFLDNPKELTNKLPIFYCIERFIEKTDIIHKICPDDQSFVVILWISMIEHFQDCCAKLIPNYKTWKNKQEKIQAFFKNPPEEINQKILCGMSFHSSICPLNSDKEIFKATDFADWLYNIRNSAVHEGNYAEIIFNQDKDKIPQMVYGRENPNRNCKHKREGLCSVNMDNNKECTYNDSYVKMLLSYNDVKEILVKVAIEKMKNMLCQYK